MLIRDVSDVLSEHGLKIPDLELLRPNEKTYRCLLLQPSGPIYAGTNRIGPLDAQQNQRKSGAFLQLAADRAAHLAVVPEYFLSWEALKHALANGISPPLDGLWVLGCESIQEPQLAEFANEVSANCLVIHEPFSGLAQDRTLLDPVGLVFHAPAKAGGTKLVCLVQFKTLPSRDPLFFEEGVLRRGTTAYRFRGVDGFLSAATIICSDAFGLSDVDVASLIDRSTLLHVQLNPDPRNSAYRQYRKTTFESTVESSVCHIVCLNWARSIVQHDENGTTENWPNIAGSAWYCPEASCSCDDALVVPNHQKGLYYTYMRERRHALFLHYDEAVFELKVPKVVTKGKAVLANRNGPSATFRYVWNGDANAWVPLADAPDPGFNSLVQANLDVAVALNAVGTACSAIDLERLLALSAGSVAAGDSWHTPRSIDSFQVGSDEVVNRITVAQDDNPAAAAFRHSRLDAAAQVRHLLDLQQQWPPQVTGLTPEARIQPPPNARPFNVVDAAGRPALVAYLGESPHPRRVEHTSANLTDLLRRGGGNDQTRLCVVYRRFGTVRFAPLPLTRFDDALNDQTDILAAEPDEGSSS